MFCVLEESSPKTWENMLRYYTNYIQFIIELSFARKLCKGRVVGKYGSIAIVPLHNFALRGQITFLF